MTLSIIQQHIDNFTRQLELLRMFDMLYPGAPILNVHHLHEEEDAIPCVSFDGQDPKAVAWVFSNFGSEFWCSRGAGRVRKMAAGIHIDIHAYQEATLPQHTVQDVHPATDPHAVMNALASAPVGAATRETDL